MSRLFKRIGYGLGGVAAVLALAALAVHFTSGHKLQKRFVIKTQPVPLPTDANALAHGRHLAETRGCNDCHGRDFAGGVVIDDGAMGLLHGPNLTRGKGGRIAGFSDADWVRAIRHGVGPDQQGLLIMPSEEYSHFTDADLGALIAYLKTVPAVDRERPATRLGPVARVLLATGKMKLAAEVIDHAAERPATLTPTATASYGQYVAHSCTGCHGPNFSGGKIEIGPPSWPEAANLTPHGSSGIAAWSETEFVATMRSAKRPDGTDLDPVMPRAFGQMNDTELKALYAFFRSLPPVAKGSR